MSATTTSITCTFSDQAGVGLPVSSRGWTLISDASGASPAAPPSTAGSTASTHGQAAPSPLSAVNAMVTANVYGATTISQAA